MMSQFKEKIRKEVRTDANIQNALKFSRFGLLAFPREATKYLLEKLPIIQWIPHYNIRWIGNDILGGLTVGVMLVPQGLAYAKIANIPVANGLFSSWLPALIYTVMGTSKEISTGPTSILGLLTATIVKDMSKENYAPEVTAAAVALMVGIYSFFLGVLKLGFLLDFISAPVLTGFISGAAIVIMLGQAASIFGLTITGSGSAAIIREVLRNLGHSKWQTVLISFSGIAILQTLQWTGKKYGKKYKVFKVLSIARAFIVLVLFTGISYGVNHNRKANPIFAIVKITSKSLPHPRLPDTNLFSKVAQKAIAPLIAAALEHIAIGKAFGLKNGYDLDPSQELVYLGVTNFFNSFFLSMPVGGAMSRTAVNSDTGVKSPLNGLLTAGVVLLAIYKLSGVLYWIPSATLAAIIVTAVYHLVGPLSLFYRFWRTSFLDFIASMVCFWITIFVSAETGIEAAAGFCVAYTLVRFAFSSPAVVKPSKAMYDSPSSSYSDYSDDAKAFRFKESILFPNARQAKDKVLRQLLVHHFNIRDAQSQSGSDIDRSWSVAGKNRIKRLRSENKVTTETLSSLRIVVLDFERVAHVDSTGLIALRELCVEISRFFGDDVEIRFVGLNDSVKTRFARFGDWDLVNVDTESISSDHGIGIYPSIRAAMTGLRRKNTNSTVSDVRIIDEPKIDHSI
ncbi:sulfate permease [Microthyrium microscopicum]|uniref:Sulfate permease n=1 Tax=Microthyrium microscopicum TaxID=703497 RepID=A0A6A6UNM5_9PEZI|nr:sulfate permease [Microthyrium microscopicum]